MKKTLKDTLTQIRNIKVESLPPEIARGIEFEQWLRSEDVLAEFGGNNEVEVFDNLIMHFSIEKIDFDMMFQVQKIKEMYNTKLMDFQDHDELCTVTEADRHDEENNCLGLAS